MNRLKSTLKWLAILVVSLPLLLVLAGLALKPEFFDVRGQQSSLYKPDTAGFYVNTIASKLGVGAPVFIFDSRDSKRYLDDLNGYGKEISGALGVSWGAVATIEKARLREEQASNGKVIAYSVRLPNTNACALVFTEHFHDNSDLFKSSVVIHELTHCGQQFLLKTQRERQRKVQDLAEEIGGDLKYGVIDTVYAESLPTAMQRALSFDSGFISEASRYGFKYELDDAKKDKRWVEAPHVAMVMPEICSKAGDCPTDLLLLQEKLIQDARYRAALRADMERWSQLRASAAGVISLGK
ncbi:hypothetical protein [Pseudomonas sp. S10E 269]|uniref:hypothetical protein n=2 Tax=unclassified Pseudomonas TaxID=196821 RepID=UPI0012FE40B2|nr:hypothetical protein [Pseudomonas sp. S10E 269]